MFSLCVTFYEFLFNSGYDLGYLLSVDDLGDLLLVHSVDISCVRLGLSDSFGCLGFCLLGDSRVTEDDSSIDGLSSLLHVFFGSLDSDEDEAISVLEIVDFF